MSIKLSQLDSKVRILTEQVALNEEKAGAGQAGPVKRLPFGKALGCAKLNLYSPKKCYNNKVLTKKKEGFRWLITKLTLIRAATIFNESKFPARSVSRSPGPPKSACTTRCPL